jgi:hypothetical protein
MTDFLVTMVDGQRALAITDDIPDSAPPIVREGLARRRLSWTEQGCPCGARLPRLNRSQRRQMAKDRKHGRGVWQVDIQHEPDCPAVAPEVERWARR